MGGDMSDAVLVIHHRDNVAVALRDLEAGEEIAFSADSEPLTVLEPVPASHKLALRDIVEGEEIIKYGEAVGVGTTLIRQGAWVHTHNLESGQWRVSRQ